MSAPIRKTVRRQPSETFGRPTNNTTTTAAAPLTDNESATDAVTGPASAHLGSSPTTVPPAAARPATALLRRHSGIQSGFPGSRSAAQRARSGDGLCGATLSQQQQQHGNATTATPAALPSTGVSGLGAPAAAMLGRSPNTRPRPSYGSSAATAVGATVQSPVLAPGASPSVFSVGGQTRSTGERATGSATPTAAAGPASLTSAISTLPSNTPVASMSNHLRLSEGLSCLDYHACFRALAIGSTRQIHVVEVIPMVGHDVAATARYKRSQQQQQQQQRQGSSAELPAATRDGEQSHTPSPVSPSSPPPPPPMGNAPFLMRNTGVFGGLIKVESVVWYPSTEEASLAFIQPARTVTIFLDALQFKMDGTYLPQQWTRSQSKGKTLTAAMAAGGGSTTMAVVANIDGGLAGMTPATSTTSLGGERSGMYTPVSTSLAGGPSFGTAPASHSGTPHEVGLPTPNSGGGGGGSTLHNPPFVYRERKGPAARELIELNIDITYMRVEKIVWDPHQPYTLALSSPTTHFELWQVPTDGMCVYAPQLVLRPPAHNTRSVVRDIVFSPSNPHVIIVVTESGNTGQVLLYDRRQVEAMRVFDLSGPGLSAAFHPLFSDLVAVSFRREKTKPDTRISFLRVMTGEAGAFKASPNAESPLTVPVTAMPAQAAAAVSGRTTLVEALDESALGSHNATVGAAAVAAGSGGGCPFLVEQSYLPPIDNYACVSRMRWRPPSLGRLTDPKRHHYMAFKPSAEDLWTARHLSAATAASSSSGGGSGAPSSSTAKLLPYGTTTWVDLLHSQLWFATAAVTTDSDISVWDAVNGFFPICAVKYLGTRIDSGSSNEANDFIWINELTLVSIFKNGEAICSSFLNSMLEDSLSMDAEAGVPSPRISQSSSPPRNVSDQQQQQQHGVPKSREDDHLEQQRRVRAEEQSCLAMLPAYPNDPVADMFATSIVLPNASIVSDLFGRSLAIRNTNARLRRHYATMLRREYGQLLRRLAIQVSREVVLRRQWAETRHWHGVGGPSSPGVVSGLAALQELRARRPRSPFTVASSGGFNGRGTSSQGSDSTPPSPRRSLLTRRFSVASSASSLGPRMGGQPPHHVPPPPPALVNASAAAAVRSPHGGASTPPSSTSERARYSAAHGTLLPPPQTWSLDDLNDALLQAHLHQPQQSQQQQRGARRDSAMAAHHDAEGPLHGRVRRLGVGGRTASTEPVVDGEDGRGLVSGGDDDTHHDGGELGDSLTGHPHQDSVAADDDDEEAEEGGREGEEGGRGYAARDRHRSGGPAAWIARLLGFERHERVSRYRASAHASRAASTAQQGAAALLESHDMDEGDALHDGSDGNDSGAEATTDFDLQHSPTYEPPELAITHPTASVLSSRRRLQSGGVAAAAGAVGVSGSGVSGLRGRPTSPISVSTVDNSESSIGSPQLLMPAGLPTQPSELSVHGSGDGASPLTNTTAAAAAAAASRGRLPSHNSSSNFLLPRTASATARPGTSANSSASPLLAAAVGSEKSPHGPGSGGGGGSNSPNLFASGGAPHLSVLYRAGGSGSNGNVQQAAASTAAAAAGGGGGTAGVPSRSSNHRHRRSGVVFAQVFPLLREYVNISGEHAERAARHTRPGRAVRSSSVPRRTASPLKKSGGMGGAARASTPVLRHRQAALLLSPALHPASTALADSPTTSPLQLPLVMSSPLDLAAEEGSRAFPAAPTAARDGERPPTHLITAHAYLDRQRDVTVAVESFLLSDVVCSWAYPERHREEAAFVCFALEWDMGYELALTMKALRHDRTDAEAAAETTTTATNAAAAAAAATSTNTGTADGGGPLPASQSRHDPQQRRRSNSSGHGPAAAAAAAAVSGDGSSRAQRRAEGRGGVPYGRSSSSATPDEAANAVTASAAAATTATALPPSSTPLLDWGGGTPAPTHEEVDDKIAAMMEANARICERVARQHRREHTQRAGTQNKERPYAKTAGHEAAEVDGPYGGNPTHASRDGGEAVSLAAPPSDGTLPSTDPRAQWWRAAAHAWRSHHVSFILTVTMQQLEYAALMGDVQYCLVLYILFCLWWRLQSEVAEAAYRAAAEALANAQLRMEKGEDTAELHHRALLGGADGAVDGVGGSGVWIGDLDNAFPAHASESGVHGRRGEEAAAEKRRGMLHVSTLTSLDGSYLNTRRPHGMGSAYGSADVSDTELVDPSHPHTMRRGSRGVYGGDRDDQRLRPISAERLAELLQLCLFFQRCPMMPQQPSDTTARSTSPATTATAAAAGAAHGGGLDGIEKTSYSAPLTTASSATRARGLSASVGGALGGSGIGGGGGGYLRPSASSQSLPPRSQNSSARHLAETPATPAMAIGGRMSGSSVAVGSGQGPLLASSHRSSNASPAPSVLRVDMHANANTSAGDRLSAAKALARAKERRSLLVNLNGLLGVRLYAESAEDLCAPTDYCAPEEWKLRALQWLDTYTADLYARQLYVPLNELLLVMPEIFREPTNPVQPRAADIAYEKQMTYVYCGSCSKAELWSRTQPEKVPAAVRLYERVVRRGRHSSSSDADDDCAEEDEDEGEYEEGGESDAIVGGDGAAGRRRRSASYRRRRRRRTRDGAAMARDTEDEEEEEAGSSGLTGRRRRAGRQRRRPPRRFAGGAVSPRSNRDSSSEDGSLLMTPSVESPTPSPSSSSAVSSLPVSDAEAAKVNGPVRTHDRGGARGYSTNSDVSLSTERTSHDGVGSATAMFNAAEGGAVDNASSRASTAGGSRASGSQQRPANPPLSQGAPIPRPQQQQQQQQEQQEEVGGRGEASRRATTALPHQHHLHSASGRPPRRQHAHPQRSRRSQDGNYGGRSADADEAERESIRVTAAAAGLDTHPHQCTAIHCDHNALTVNNAACRRCHNRVAMTCVICEEVVEGVFFWLRSCGHGGHVHHIEEWLRYSHECPKCGTPITATWKES